MYPMLKDPKVVKFLREQMENKTNTSSVIIEELPNTIVGVLTVAAITISLSNLEQLTLDETTKTTNWSTHELLRDQMMLEISQPQAELEHTTST